MRIKLMCLTFVVAAGAAFAHQGAMGVVKERMDAMGRVQGDAKVIGQMLRGQTVFDADTARAALDRLVEEARAIPGHFEVRDVSAPSEARELIWTEFDAFSGLADEMANAAMGPADTPEALRQTFIGVGAACGACHEKYRAKTD